MAAIYKTILRYQGVEYVWVENRLNSATALIETLDRKTNQHIDYPATIRLKTGKITYHRELPAKVVEVIEQYESEGR